MVDLYMYILLITNEQISQYPITICFYLLLSYIFYCIDNSPVMTSGVIDKIWSLPLSSTDDNKSSSVEAVTESTSGACPQPTTQLPSLNEQSSTNNSVKGS